MKHRSLLFLAALSATLGAGAQNYFEAGGVTYRADEPSATAVAVGYAKGETEELHIPRTISHGEVDYTVAGIEFSCMDDTSLTSVSIDAAVSSLWSDFFSRCTALRSVELPEGLLEIGYRFFEKCTSLSSVSFPKSLEKIGSYAFLDCTSLREVPYAVGIHELPEGIFFGCSSLDSIVIPENIRSIGSWAFGSCSGLRAVAFGAQVKRIETSAFSECSALQRFYYGGTMADWCRTSIELVPHQENTSPLSYAQEWYISDGNGQLKPVGDLVIPEEVDSIGELAFYGYKKAKHLFVPDAVEYIGSEAFGGCSGLAKVRIGARTVASHAFHSCAQLDTVVIGAGVRSMGAGTFMDCPPFSDVFFEGGLKDWFSLSFSGAAGNPINGAARFYVQGELVENLVVPQDVDCVPNFAFYRYKGLKSIRFSPQVRSIGASAFAYCENLQAVFPESGSTFSEKSKDFLQEGQGLFIGSKAFFYCDRLAEFDFGVEIAEVGADAFDGTDWYINHPDGMLYVGTSAYRYKGSMAEGTVFCLKEGTTQVCDEAFEPIFEEQRLGEIVLPQSLRIIGKGAFSRCRGLTKMEIPPGVVSIGEQAFWYCTNLKEVSLPPHLEAVENGLFSGCSSIESLVIPAGVRRFYFSALEKMEGLRHLVFEDGADTLAFVRASISTPSISVEKLYLGRDLTMYTSEKDKPVVRGDFSLYYLSPALKEAVVGPLVTTIPTVLFESCLALEKITSLAQNPPLCLRYDEVGEYYNFYGVDPAKCVLHVPSGTQPAYAAAGGWSYFFRVEEDPAVGIGTIEADGSEAGAEHFDARGLPVDAGAKGLHIIRYPDGRTEKRWVD